MKEKEDLKIYIPRIISSFSILGCLVISPVIFIFGALLSFIYSIIDFLNYKNKDNKNLYEVIFTSIALVICLFLTIYQIVTF